jgi:carbon monoxide dehydrogenase subunit G
VTRFSAQTTSEATLDAAPERVWTVLTDPELLPRLTPYLTRIDADGKHWTWHLTRIPVLSTAIQPSFTELMDFEEQRRIGFTHDPGHADERTGVDGEYRLHPAGEGTRVAIDLTIWVELPLPGLARPAVQTVMHTVIAGMGRIFAGNMRRHLGE